MAFQTIDGIIDEPQVNFVGKDGFFWWVGEVEDNEDPMELGRVKCRVLGYYTNVRGGTTGSLDTKHLPWATVLQHTCQPGNDGQGESSHQLQPGAVVMGFFMDGDSAQMPIVIGVMRIKKKKSNKKKFVFTGAEYPPGVGPNTTRVNPAEPNNTIARKKEDGLLEQENNTVSTPGDDNEIEGSGSPKSIATSCGVVVSIPQPSSKKGIPAANGVGGPWKTLESQLSYLFDDLADTAGRLTKAEDGDFLDMISGKLVTAQELTGKIQNFLGAVFTQVVSAMRQSLVNLADSLKITNLLVSATGIPYATWALVQSAVTTILNALCNIDSQIINFINDPVGTITDVLESYLEGLIDKATMVVRGVQETINNVICNVQVLINTVAGVVTRVQTIVGTVGKAKELIEAWKKGTGIFADGFDLMKNGISSLTGLLKLFLKFLGSNCNRPAKGGELETGYFPLFGTTKCSEEELETINKIRGGGRGLCGDGNPCAQGSLFDSIFNEADPFLNAASTFIDGSFELHIGTPGRQALQRRYTSGTYQESFRLNNHTYATWKVYKELKKEAEKQGKDWTEVEIKEQAEKSVAQNNANSPAPKGDRGCLVGDNIAWAGVRTQQVNGDDIMQCKGDTVLNVDGDYHLKVTGDCHIEVGGGFFFSAQGSPKVVDKKGKKKDTKIQKHQISFGSDVDIMTSGAKFEVQAAEIALAGTSTTMSGSIFENSAVQQTYSGGECIQAFQGTMEVLTTQLTYQINNPVPNPLAAKSGIFTFCSGSIDTVQTPGSGTDVIPRNTLTTPGPVIRNSAATGETINTTIFQVNSAAATKIIAGGLVKITSVLKMTLDAKLVMTLKGKTIKLN